MLPDKSYAAKAAGYHLNSLEAQEESCKLGLKQGFPDLWPALLFEVYCLA